jgi:hypothetical protein
MFLEGRWGFRAARGGRVLGDDLTIAPAVPASLDRRRSRRLLIGHIAIVGALRKATGNEGKGWRALLPPAKPVAARRVPSWQVLRGP